jgi:hypothetical protein
MVRRLPKRKPTYPVIGVGVCLCGCGRTFPILGNGRKPRRFYDDACRNKVWVRAHPRRRTPVPGAP